MGDRRRYGAHRVVGAGRTEELLTTEIALPEPAMAVLEVRKTVLIDRIDLTLGSAILQGRLRALFVFAALRHGSLPPPVGALSPTASVAGGPLHTLETETPFCFRIAAAAARPDRHSRLVEAHVTGGTTALCQVDGQGAIRRLLDRSVLVLGLLVLAEEEIAPETGQAGPGRAPAPGKARKISAPAPGGGAAPSRHRQSNALAHFASHRKG